MRSNSLVTLERLQFLVLQCFLLFDFFSISLAHLCGFLGGGLWLWHTHRSRLWKSIQFPLALPMGLWAIASLLAVATALDPARSFTQLKRLLEMVVFVWSLNLLRTGSHHSLWATLPEKLRARFRQHVSRLQALNLRDTLLFGGIAAAVLAASLGLVQGMIRGISLDARVSGTLSIYMTFAGLLMQAGVIASAYLIFPPGRRRWMALALALIITGLLISLTRQTWFGFVVGLGMVLLIRKPLWLLIPPLIAGVLLVASPKPVQDRITSMTDMKDGTFQSRLRMWELGWDIFTRHPITGCGFRCLEVVSGDYPEHEDFFREFRHVHNNFIQIALDTGLIGLTAWLFLWASYYWKAFLQYRRLPEDSTDKWIVLGSIGSVTAFLAGGLFECNFYDSEVVLFCYFAMALPWTVSMDPKKKVPHEIA